MEHKRQISRTPAALKWRWVSLALVSTLLITTGVMTRSPSPSFAASGDWPQLGHDPQRTNYTSVQVDPPYCYTWKWYEVPIVSRAQPVVADGRLFIGSMNGLLYARNASTGAPLWSFASQGPIRHSAGVMGSTVVFSSHDGYTYALNAANGALQWRANTGPSETAPLMDEARGWVYVASGNGKLTALSLANGAQMWQYDAGAPILTSPSLSTDGQTVFLGSEDIRALAVRASDGVERWRALLQGQSLADRYPVVVADTVIYRSQPVYHFHLLLHEGDDIMDQAGSVNSNWDSDWANVRPRIVNYLTAEPAKQTFFVLDAATGASRGVAPVLYTYGTNDIPNVPVIRNGSAYITYRARHGIQTDGGAVHVTSKYDAELGQMDVASLNIAGLRQAGYPAYHTEFRMTSDEAAMLSMGGNILWVDSWERFGGLNVSSGQLIHVGAVSNDWPECGAQCGPGTTNPFFPLSGRQSDPAYPFPSPRITEGHQRGGVVIANNMLYWRTIEGGLAGISHRAGSSCPAPLVYTTTLGGLSSQNQSNSLTSEVGVEASRPLADYVALDLTVPVANPPADLVNRLREEARAIVTANGHLTPFYLERGFSQPFLWPYNVSPGKSGLPSITYNGTGNAYWHDPGELLYTMALAYPYLDAPLQASAKQYMATEMNRYPPLQDLPWGSGSDQPAWLKQGVARERYAVPFRSSLNNWPPPAASMSALYALWLWSKNTMDWSYAQSHWANATSLYNSRRDSMRYYADAAGAIGYARMAAHFGDTDAYNNAAQVAVTAMQAGQNFTTFRDYANGQYVDPHGEPAGIYVPVFYGMTPEVGLYLREQTGGQARSHLIERESGDSGLRWWYLTRAGQHGETGETSYIAPIAAWSHFLAHAYVVGDSQDTLRQWLDRPWARGDLYSIQKIVATIQAAPNGSPAPTDLHLSSKIAQPSAAKAGQAVTYVITILNQGAPLTETARLTDIVPGGLTYVPHSLTTTKGITDDGGAPTLSWSGILSNTPSITISYTVIVAETKPRVVVNTARLDGGSAGRFDISARVIANGVSVYLPMIIVKETTSS